MRQMRQYKKGADPINNSFFNLIVYIIRFNVYLWANLFHTYTMKIPTKIVAIGGGEITKGETLAIDKRIIQLSGKKSPKVLFIPTASSDSESYCSDFKQYYGNKLGCKVSFLYLSRNKNSKQEIKSLILNSDVIYVGGGNTLKMMKLWRKIGVDRLLKKALNNGTVLCGISAGAICWFEGGHSDSMSFYNPEKWKYINVTGLGFLKGIMCPHYNSATYGIPRKNKFREMISQINNIGIAIEDRSAIEFINDTFRVIDSDKSFGAYKVYKNMGKVFSDEIRKSSPRLVKNLYAK